MERQLLQRRPATTPERPREPERALPPRRAPLTPAAVLALQRTSGNAAVTRALARDEAPAATQAPAPAAPPPPARAPPRPRPGARAGAGPGRLARARRDLDPGDEPQRGAAGP